MLTALFMSLTLHLSPFIQETENYLPYFRVEISSDEKVWLLAEKIEGTGIYTEAACNCGNPKRKEQEPVPVIKSDEDEEEVILFVNTNLGNVILLPNHDYNPKPPPVYKVLFKSSIEVVGQDDEGRLLVNSANGNLPEIIVENASGFSAVRQE